MSNRSTRANANNGGHTDQGSTDQDGDAGPSAPPQVTLSKEQLKTMMSMFKDEIHSQVQTVVDKVVGAKRKQHEVSESDSDQDGHGGGDHNTDHSLLFSSSAVKQPL